MSSVSVRFDAADGWRYGLLGLPLAFVALPLYVLLPNHYARQFGLPLAALGALLLAVRLLDAVLDPWIGRLCDRLFARSHLAVLRLGRIAAAVLAAAFALLFFPPVRGEGPLLAWAACALVLTSLAFSVLAIGHQSWGAMLGGDEQVRSRVVAWREACGLLGVLLASVLPLLAGFALTSLVLAATLAFACATWASGPRPHIASHGAPAAWQTPWRSPAFRALLAVFMLNGIASAVPATLVLFFVQDRLQAPPAMESLFLGAYFLCAAAAIPAWLALVPRIGLATTWLAGMLLAVFAFAAAASLQPGELGGFLLVCALSGAALGTDLALPGALLAGVIGAAGHRGRSEGAYFGWWNCAGKLNLALAAGVALPLLALAGYVPGSRDPAALQALTLAYCVLPCLLKLAAAALLWRSLIRTEGSP
jgi:glycoside/pentoside/hexuronide:cation symporter, GPH family